MLYTIAYLQSPFEAATEAGGSISLAVLNGSVHIPSSSRYPYGVAMEHWENDSSVLLRFSKSFTDLILYMLQVNRGARPYIDEVVVSHCVNMHLYHHGHGLPRNKPDKSCATMS